jgi:hypothetical protein
MFNNLTKSLSFLSLIAASYLAISCGQKPAEPTSAPVDGIVLQSAQDYKVYYIFGDKRHYIPNPATLDSLGLAKQIKVVPESVLSGIPLGSDLPALSSRVLQKASTGEVFILENGIRRHIPDPETLKAMRIPSEQIHGVPDTVADAFPLGSPLPHSSDSK